MELIQVDLNIQSYLQSDNIIDYATDCAITRLAKEIESNSADEIDFIKNAYTFVRDKISHTADIDGNIITCAASEVLRHKEGICFAKSHLLTAILRCRNIPAGLCYQRLVLDDTAAPYLILHGLTGVYINQLHKWIRLDSRGNKEGVNAQFSIEEERLAFPIRPELGEEDIPIVFAPPDNNVISTLKNAVDIDWLWKNLPKDICKENRKLSKKYSLL